MFYSIILLKARRSDGTRGHYCLALPPIYPLVHQSTEFADLMKAIFRGILMRLSQPWETNLLLMEDF